MGPREIGAFSWAIDRVEMPVGIAGRGRWRRLQRRVHCELDSPGFGHLQSLGSSGPWRRGNSCHDAPSAERPPQSRSVAPHPDRRRLAKAYLTNPPLTTGADAGPKKEAAGAASNRFHALILHRADLPDNPGAGDLDERTIAGTDNV